MTVLLSICIPTYNRANMLREAINSILAQADERLEIVVSDNASTDDTCNMMRILSQAYPLIKYFRFPENYGADRNFLNAVKQASGRYAWLLGSDDMVARGGVAKVFSVIASYPNLPGFSVNRQMYDISMTRQLPDMSIFPSQLQPVRVHQSDGEAIGNLGVYLSYISGQIFRRDAWLHYSSEACIDKYFNGLVHLYPLYSLIRDFGTWGAVETPTVLCRADNDSFLSDGYFKRFEIDLIGFSRAASDVFGKYNPIYLRLMKSVLRSLMVNRVINFKLTHVSHIYFKCFFAAFPVAWRLPRFWVVFVPILLLPPPVIRYALRLRSFVKSFVAT